MNKKAFFQCLNCKTKIYYETEKSRLTFKCKTCNCGISFFVPQEARSKTLVKNDPILEFVPPAEPASYVFASYQKKKAPAITGTPSVHTKPSISAPKKKSVQPNRDINKIPNSSSSKSKKSAPQSSDNAYFKINPSSQKEMDQYFEHDYPELLQDCPSQESSSNYIIRNVFPSGVKGNYIVTNNAYPIGEDTNYALAVRSTASNFLQSRLYDNDLQLRVSGFLILPGLFVIHNAAIVPATSLVFNQKQISFRVVYNDTGAYDSCLVKAVDELPSFSYEMQNELAEWSDYLEWKQKLAEIKIRSVKYIAVRITEDTWGPNGIAFLAVASDADAYTKFCKALKREADHIVILSNNFSKNLWTFSYSNNKITDREFDELIYRQVEQQYAPDYQWTEEETISYLKKGQNLSLYDAKAFIEASEELFPDPVYFEVQFDLPKKTEEEIQNLSAEESYTYISQHLLSKVHTDGFIATSRLGDFLLNKRLQKAVDELKTGKATSGNLGNWIFDITKARNATVKDGELAWSPWGRGHLNEAQKRIVKEMLAAPDVYLCQGPPGTGKTTVIAEIVYQLALRNKRVLIASQTNLAVNNALSRLSDYPGIRAVRLGDARKLDESVADISESQILHTFFHKVKRRAEKKYLSQWEKDDAEFERLYRDKQYCCQLTEEYSILQTEVDHSQTEIKSLEEKIERMIIDSEANYEAAEFAKNIAMRTKAYSSDLKNKKVPYEKPFLELSQAQDLYKHLKNIVEAFDRKGFHLLPERVEIQNGFKELTKKEANFAVHDIAVFLIFAVNSLNIQQSPENDERLLRELHVQKRELEEKDEPSYEEYLKLQGIKRRIKTIQAGNTDTLIPNDIIRFFPFDWIDSEKKDVLKSEKQVLFASETVSLAQKGLDLLTTWLDDCEQKMNQQFEQSDEALDKARHEKKILGSKLQQIKEKAEEHTRALLEMSVKYHCEISELGAVIKKKLENLQEKQNANVSRAEFEPFLREFVAHVDAADRNYQMENDEYLKTFINACNVVGISCTEKSDTLTNAGFNTFHVAIIDEVSKATPPELLIPLLLAEKAILVGDHRQLPPLFNEHEVTYQEYIEDIDDDEQETKELLSPDNYRRFEELVTNSLFKRHYENANPANKGPLLKQYRMHSDIMKVVNEFYDGRLESGIPAETENIVKAHHAIVRGPHGKAVIISPEHHAYWIDSSMFQSKPVYEIQSRGSSKYNRLEAVLIAEMIKQIDESYYAENPDQTVEVGIISFYAAQVREIQKELRRLGVLKCVVPDVNTVDRFQGKEKPIVIVSLVRNVPKGKKYDATYVKAYQRINVAVSRAQNLLLLVGAKDMYVEQEIVLEDMETGERLEPQRVYRNIIDTLNMSGCFISADQLLGEEAADMVFEVPEWR